MLLWQVIKIFHVEGGAGEDSATVVPYSQLLKASPFQENKEKLDAFLARYQNVFFTYGSGLPVAARAGTLDEKTQKQQQRHHGDGASAMQSSVSSLELLGYVGFTNPVFKTVFERLRHDEEVQREMWQKNRRR